MPRWILTLALTLASAGASLTSIGCGEKPAPTTGPDAPKPPGEGHPGP